MARRKKASCRTDDLLCNVRFVKVASVPDLEVAMALQVALREARIASVIINDEKLQARSETARRQAVSHVEGFRLEVQEEFAGRAREIIEDLLDPEHGEVTP